MRQSVRTKAVLSCLFLLSLAVASLAAQDQQIGRRLEELKAVKGPFQFVVLGDTRTGDDIYQKLVGMIAARKPLLVMHTGDMIMQAGSVKEWENFWRMSKPIAAPYFFAVGNHDIHPKAIGSDKTYLEQVDLPGNELYYSFTVGNALFIVLDSYLEGQERRISGEQLKWLEQQLNAPKQRHIFVFLHHPLYTDPVKGRHKNDSIDKFPEERDRLAQLFVKHKVDAVFVGHEHFYDRTTQNGLLQVLTGGGGAPMYDTDENGGFNHFVVVSVDGDRVSAEVIDINGKVRDKF